MLSQGASSPADPNRHPRSQSSNKGRRHRHIHRVKDAQTIGPRPPGAARQSSRPRDAPHRPPPCPRKRHQPNKQKGGKERPQHTQQRGHTPPRDAEPPTFMPAKQKRWSQAKLQFPPQQHHTSFHTLDRGTNPKHTPPTRNHPADKQTPPQHKAERPNATAKPSDARPAVQNTEARAATHRTTTPTPQHAKQRRTVRSHQHPKWKPCTEPTPCKCVPTSPPKKKPPAKVHPREKKTHSIQVQEHAQPQCPCLK
ncbi:hypothetical protein ATANTOWER_028197 [Ataeniobius toweri]|uniref:Uncharacterized protein n=1 Tax=Ataeniobius toweri TaxID=208326 RepID=A0ABU7BIJ4_9TELE|nr:hypothetical protein [Ataeniobius toweri]